MFNHASLPESEKRSTDKKGKRYRKALELEFSPWRLGYSLSRESVSYVAATKSGSGNMHPKVIEHRNQGRRVPSYFVFEACRWLAVTNCSSLKISNIEWPE